MLKNLQNPKPFLKPFKRGKKVKYTKGGMGENFESCGEVFLLVIPPITV